MNRTIKFRGKVKESDRWIKGQYNQRGHFITWDEGNHQDYFVDESTVGQFTGLHDKNGKEIFEGDVVRCNTELYKVVWGNKASGFRFEKKGGYYYNYPYDFDWEFDTIEVVGNVYDNPELLKEDKQTNNDTAERIIRIIEDEYSEGNPVTVDTILSNNVCEGVFMDSLDKIEFVMRIEKEFNISILDEEIDQFTESAKVSDVVDFVNKKLKEESR